MKKKADSNQIANSIKEAAMLIFLNGQFYKYKNGKYEVIEQNEITAMIFEVVEDDFSGGLNNEVLSVLKAQCFLRQDELNIPENKVNFKNGLLDLETFELNEHSPEHHFFAQIDADYDPNAQHELWSSFLNEVLSDDMNKALPLQEFFGYCLCAETNLEKALLLLGDGANGKSVVLNVLQGIIGLENCSAIQMDDLENKNYRAELFEKIVNISTESNVKKHFYEGVFKLLVSGEMVTADRKYFRPFKFRNVCKLAFAFNQLPRVDDKTNAFYRRLILLPFNYSVPQEEQNINLTAELLTEKSGILNWAVEGLARLRRNKAFTPVDSITESVESYRQENNNLFSFVEDCCFIDNDAWCEVGELYFNYNDFCKRNGFQPLNKTHFGKLLSKTFPSISKERTSDSRIWSGIGMKNNFVSLQQAC